MRKLLLLALFVIVLVSLNWFQRVLAQDLSSLSPSEMERLRSAYEKSSTSVQSSAPDYYESPEIYGADTSVGPVPLASLILT